MKTFFQSHENTWNVEEIIPVLSRDSFYSCMEHTSDHILNTVCHLSHHIWEKILTPWSSTISCYTKLVKSLSTLTYEY